MKTYIFKEIQTQKELEKAFRLRYDIYENTPNRVFLKENQKRMDIDAYDSCSRHHGIFDGKTLIGYVRIVYEKLQECSELVAEIIGKNKISVSIKNKNLPFLNYSGVPKSHFDFFEKLKIQKEKVTEASRLMLHPDYRQARLAKGLLESIMSKVVLLNDISTVILNCGTCHKSLYEYFGFKNIDSEKPVFLTHNIEKVTLSAPMVLEKIPVRFQEKIFSLGNELSKSNQIIINL